MTDEGRIHQPLSVHSTVHSGLLYNFLLVIFDTKNHRRVYWPCANISTIGFNHLSLESALPTHRPIYPCINISEILCFSPKNHDSYCINDAVLLKINTVCTCKNKCRRYLRIPDVEMYSIADKAWY